MVLHGHALEVDQLRGFFVELFLQLPLVPVVRVELVLRREGCGSDVIWFRSGLGCDTGWVCVGWM